METLDDFTAVLACMPEVSRNDSCAAFSLASQVDIQKPFFHEEFVPKWSLRSAIEHTGNSEEELGPRFWETPIPCKILVKQAFFLQKEAEVQWEAACLRQTKLQEKFASFKKECADREARKRAKAQAATEQLLLKNSADGAEVRDQALARRNQINRVRKSIQKPKRVRPEEDGLPEAGPVCQRKTYIIYIYMFYTCLQTCAYESINTSYSNSRFRGPEIVRTCGQSSS